MKDVASEGRDDQRIADSSTRETRVNMQMPCTDILEVAYCRTLPASLTAAMNPSSLPAAVRTQ